MIQTRQMTRRFGPVTALDRVDLDIDQQGVVGFLGPNGAGKTTTNRILCGTLPQTSGDVVVCGHDVFDDPMGARRSVGYLPDRPPLYDALTVGEYLRFAAELRGVPARECVSRVGEVMEQTGLRGWEDRLIEGLSRGYRQRVGLAQALVHRPRVLVLDEPTSGLDPAQLIPIRALIEELASDRLVLLSTHILQEVEQLCERVVLLSRGRVAGDGTVQALAKQVGAGPWVELVVDETADLSSALAQNPTVDTVERLASGRYRLTGDCVREVAAMARAKNWELRALTPHRPDLAQVFVRLTAAS